MIGVSKYKDDTIPVLQYASKDAADFSKFLVDKANFAPDHIRLLLDEQATKEEILTELGDTFLPRVVKPDDLVVLYFSTHGSPSRTDVRGRNFLVAYDTKKNNLYATGIEMQALSDLLTDRVGANRVLIVLDACHSGGAQDGSKELMREGVGVEQVRLGKGHLIVSSSTRDQRSWESKRYNNGVFTRKFIESLQLKGRETGLSEDFGYLKESVSDEVQQDRGAAQLPQLKSDTWTGNELRLSAPPARPAPLPPAVAKLLQPDANSADSTKAKPAPTTH